jgi:hypothetical protein
VRRQKFDVNARAVVVAFKLRGAGNLEQIAIAGVILRQQQHVERALVQLGVAVGHTAARQVAFHAEDRLNLGIDGGLIEILHAVHGAVVGDRQRWHLQRFRALDNFLDFAQAIEQRKFGMNVQMNK